MKIIFLAEHWDPLLGGATHLTKKIIEGIAGLTEEVSLIVPNSSSNETEIDTSNYPFTVIKIGVGVDITDRTAFRGKKRAEFAKKTDAYLKGLTDEQLPDVLQIMTGMYLLRWVDVPYLKKKGVKTVANLLNIPPEESGLSWPGDRQISYLKDKLRLQLVKWVNKKRIIHQEFDAYTVISNHTKNQLANYIGKNKDIKVIHLACEWTGYEPDLSNNKDAVTTSLLTVGGINPSKNQHFVPQIARMLKDDGVPFTWHVIGPDRNLRYTSFLTNQISKLGVDKEVTFIPGLPKNELMEYYKTADIYVQPSKEEGFCMTALDAVLYGLPLVGSTTGAIPEFIQEGTGVLVQNSPDAYYKAIKKILADPESYISSQERIRHIGETYTWAANASDHVELYNELLA